MKESPLERTLENLRPRHKIMSSDFVFWVENRRENRPLAASSAAIYKTMWEVFVAWAAKNSLVWSDLTSNQLESFLHYRSTTLPSPLSSQQKRRYLNLIANISSVAVCEDAKLASVICHKFIENNFLNVYARKHQPLPMVLTKDQSNRFVNALERLALSEDIKDIRGAAMLACLLGAGLKPSETLKLKFRNLVFSEESNIVKEITFPASRYYEARIIPIDKWAQTFLTHWVAIALNQQEINIKINNDNDSPQSITRLKNSLIFPSFKENKTLSNYTLIRLFKKIEKECFLSLDQGGAHILRHTWAINTLINASKNLTFSVSIDDIRYWLGLHSQTTIIAYKKLLNK